MTFGLPSQEVSEGGDLAMAWPASFVGLLVLVRVLCPDPKTSALRPPDLSGRVGVHGHPLRG